MCVLLVLAAIALTNGVVGSHGTVRMYCVLARKSCLPERRVTHGVSPRLNECSFRSPFGARIFPATNRAGTEPLTHTRAQSNENVTRKSTNSHVRALYVTVLRVRLFCYSNLSRLLLSLSLFLVPPLAKQCSHHSPPCSACILSWTGKRQ